MEKEGSHPEIGNEIQKKVRLAGQAQQVPLKSDQDLPRGDEAKSPMFTDSKFPPRSLAIFRTHLP
jgi:hypothetical protein